MARLTSQARSALRSCGCSDDEIAQVESLCTCGCTEEAIQRLRHYRAQVMEDLHERQGQLDGLDSVVRSLRRGA